MKRISFYLLLFTILLSACQHNDDDGKTPAESLPEATQTGRGIFACLVDGKPFVDRSGVPNGISFNCFYQYVDGEYYFGIGSRIGNRKLNSVSSLGINTRGLELTEGNYYLKNNQAVGAYAIANVNISSTDIMYTFTNDEYYGELSITKFDLQQQIISGKFWMNFKNPVTNDTIKITEGRFDTRFGR